MNISIALSTLLFALAGGARAQDAEQDAGSAFVRLGSLKWAPGALNNDSARNPGEPYASPSDPKAVTHTLTLRHPADGAKKVVVGCNRNGGGYCWGATLYGYFSSPLEPGGWGYGRGMLGSIRDDLH